MLVGDNKGHTYLGIVLKKVFVLAFHVEFVGLMLPKSVESLVVRTVEYQLPREPIALTFGNIIDVYADFAVRNAIRPKALSARRLVQQRLAFGILERHFARLLADNGLHSRSFHAHCAVCFADVALGFRRLRHDDKALALVGQHISGRGPHSYDAIAHDLQANHAGLTARGAHHDLAIG